LEHQIATEAALATPPGGRGGAAGTSVCVADRERREQLAHREPPLEALNRRLHALRVLEHQIAAEAALATPPGGRGGSAAATVLHTGEGNDSVAR
jgi:hypothetical protein